MAPRRTPASTHGAEIGPRPDYRYYGKAHGGYGSRVTQPSEIKGAVEQALIHEAERKLTVIDVVLSDFNPRLCTSRDEILLGQHFVIKRLLEPTGL